MTEPRENESRDARREDPGRFLRELRRLRGQAGLDHAELAARAHYPCDVIKAAEAGPSLPDLPVLSAYVRGCGGTPAEWEERWRAVAGRPASPLLATRAAGWSEAADAGARVGAASASAEGHDPHRVMAALNRVADGMAAAASSSTPPGVSDGAISHVPAGDLAAAADWESASEAGDTMWDSSAAASVWDREPGPSSVWDPAPKVPSAWNSTALPDPVWDAAPAIEEVWEPTPAPASAPGPAREPAPPAASVWEPARQARQAGYPAAAAQDGAAAGRINGVASRSTATSAPAGAKVASPQPQRTRPSWRVFAAIAAVALIAFATVLAVFG